MYFQLEDIIPIAAPLFNEEDLLPLINFTKEECSLTLLDMRDDTKRIIFTAPVREWNGNAAVTPVQAMGATITYMRRYLYQIALDIVETDEMESGAAPANVTLQPAPAKIPLTAENREAVANTLAAPEGNATPLQVAQLKKKLKELRTKYPDGSKEEWIAGIAIETQAFAKVTKVRCEEILTQVAQMLEG